MRMVKYLMTAQGDLGLPLLDIIINSEDEQNAINEACRKAEALSKLRYFAFLLYRRQRNEGTLTWRDKFVGQIKVSTETKSLFKEG